MKSVRPMAAPMVRPADMKSSRDYREQSQWTCPASTGREVPAAEEFKAETQNRTAGRTAADPSKRSRFRRAPATSRATPTREKAKGKREKVDIWFEISSFSLIPSPFSLHTPR